MKAKKAIRMTAYCIDISFILKQFNIHLVGTIDEAEDPLMKTGKRIPCLYKFFLHWTRAGMLLFLCQMYVYLLIEASDERENVIRMRHCRASCSSLDWLLYSTQSWNYNLSICIVWIWYLFCLPQAQLRINTSTSSYLDIYADPYRGCNSSRFKKSGKFEPAEAFHCRYL